MKINMKYIFVFFILLITETIIALFVNDSIIRPYIGDVLVIILMYTLIRGIIQKPTKFLPIYLLLFASTIEVCQYFNLVNMLCLQDNKVIATIIGSTFDIRDILCYLVATMIIFIWEKIESDTRCERF
ncbi:DUF2809 domain-containing protein [Abyssisolibacter fermentans]|uniref:ribosomal maturation YjgA family protein n=1 Tax=Abyssisolibacter fermentans TaxID=1766203 RepID=UPI0008347502|nr:DUF2809 domain-containing protein [Abyssisolibacter fermentans]